MRVVQDLLFGEELHFMLRADSAAIAKAGTWNIAQAATRACALVGLELRDYDIVMWHPVGNRVRIELKSRAWRERWKRIARMG